jgi:Type I restriction enzyme R protein N terminus (HSDR_N)
MVAVRSASEITLNELKQQFQLVRSMDASFFPEWQQDLPNLSQMEEAMLDRVQQNYLDQLEQRFLIEETVKMVVVAPLLDLAGFYRLPFQIESEVPVVVEVPGEDDALIQGRIDTLIVQGQLWVLVVESKRTQLSVQTAVPQALAYLLSRDDDRPHYGLITNGGEFVFLKLGRHPQLTYALSNSFSVLNLGNDLYPVLQVLKAIGQQARPGFAIPAPPNL